MTSSGFADNPLCHREERSLRSDAAISAIALVTTFKSGSRLMAEISSSVNQGGFFRHVGH